MEEYREFVNFSPLQRMRRMKVWVLLVAAGLAAGIYGIHSYWSGLHPLVQEMNLVAAKWDLHWDRLQKIESEIKAESASGKNTERLIDEQTAVREKLKQAYDRLQTLYADCARNETCQVEQFILREPIEQSMREYLGAWIDWFLATARASDDVTVQDTQASRANDSLDRVFIVRIVLAIIGAMYLFSIFKVFFSSNPRNMKVAIDTMKAITGFWFGLVTSLVG